MKVSVIIPTYQRCDSLKRALTSLSGQTFPNEDYEVIVSVDGSTDSTMEMLEGYQAPYELRTIWKPNAGRSAARNRGIEEAKGDVLIFLDDDMEALPGLIENHYKHHRDNGRFCVLGKIPVNISDRSTPLDIYLAETVYTPFMSRLFSPDYRFQGLEFYSGNFSIRRDVLREIGFFNTGYSVSEDCELGIRIARAGVEIVFEPDAGSRQYIEKDFEELAELTIERGVTAVLFTLDHPDTFCFRRICEYNTGPVRWRFVRNRLIRASRMIPQIPGIVASFIRLLENIIPDRMDRYYNLSLDYYFWLGVTSALENLKNRKELESRIKSHREPRRYDFISTI
ncbi:MAG: glycosyltransferase family 2 protein [Thermodesulfobacteriota bacterium]